MNIRDALEVFRKYGESPTSQSYHKLIMRYHPDRGGNLAITQEIIAAWNLLKKHPLITQSNEPKKRDTTEASNIFKHQFGSLDESIEIVYK